MIQPFGLNDENLDYIPTLSSMDDEIMLLMNNSVDIELLNEASISKENK